MIKIFCDCCGKEIDPRNISEHSTNALVIPFKRVNVSQDKHISHDFLIQLVIQASIYEPDNLLNEVKSDNFVGRAICLKCVIEALTQKEE